MIKKFALALMFCCILNACGKKSDPEYKDPQKTTNIPKVLIDKA
tara:strand:+ start:203 stop:334 length:132 start_codon:yes stop_codon:yes gene_type:complete